MYMYFFFLNAWRKNGKHRTALPIGLCVSVVKVWIFLFAFQALHLPCSLTILAELGVGQERIFKH